MAIAETAPTIAVEALVPEACINMSADDTASYPPPTFLFTIDATLTATPGANTSTSSPPFVCKPEPCSTTVPASFEKVGTLSEASLAPTVKILLSPAGE